jgi:hypothetical protein
MISITRIIYVLLIIALCNLGIPREALSAGECRWDTSATHVSGYGDTPLPDPCESMHGTCWTFNYPDCEGCEATVCVVTLDSIDRYDCDCRYVGSGGNLNADDWATCTEYVILDSLSKGKVCTLPEPCLNCEVDEEFEQGLQDLADSLTGINQDPKKVNVKNIVYFCESNPPSCSP